MKRSRKSVKKKTAVSAKPKKTAGPRRGTKLARKPQRSARKPRPITPATRASGSAYASSGVDHERKHRGLEGMVAHLRGTFGNNARARVAAELGSYASVLELAESPLAIAISTDSVGTKVLVAQAAGRHDTIGIDCVAMNANDVACVGANPIAMVDYIAVNVVDPDVMEQLAKGLAEGARRAELSIPGGEIAQVHELVKGEGAVHYDLVGTCVGIGEPSRLVDGTRVRPGDVVVGIASSGLHSNGYSLARRVLLKQMGKSLDARIPECGRSVADELLEPTAMYVRECKALLRQGTPVRALFNITGGGFTNLLRFRAEGCGILLDQLPEIPPIFSVLERAGGVSAAEMHQVFNLGVGFAVIVPEGYELDVIRVARLQDKRAWTIGRVVEDPEQRLVITRPSLPGALVARQAKGAIVPADSVPPEHRA